MSYILPPKIEKEKSDPKTLFYKITAISIGVFLFFITIQYSYNFFVNKKDNSSSGNVLGVKTQNNTDDLKSKLVLPPVTTPNTQKPIVNAKNYILVDQKSATTIVSKDEHQSVPIASMTKLMTAILTVEKSKLDDIATVSKNAVYTNGSKINLAIDEKITVESLLNALLINSANDSAIALAEHISGTEEKFVELMNEKARELKMVDTNLLDPAGLNDEGKSSAHDIAVLLSYALRFETIKNILKISEKDITSIDRTLSHHLVNSNRLVKEEMFYSGIIGGKTGFTPAAGHNLVSAAERDNHVLISVIINTYSNTVTASAEECKNLLEWGFNNLKYY